MKEIKPLAIVIPVYKNDFFQSTLESLANQTCKNFSVYIGDDCSPHDFAPLICKFSNVLDIHYTKFEYNIGRMDLVGQWERCIDLSQEEPWLWLFSDDDVMEPNCVEDFYKEIALNPDISLVHFDVRVIDSNNEFVKVKQFEKSDFPSFFTAKEFAKSRLRYKVNSFVVEYAFRRDTFIKNGRFQNFDLAWGSDDATWIKLSKENGLSTIRGSRVRWRLSDANITPRRNSDIMLRKLHSVISYLNFLDSQFKDSSMERLYYWYYIHALYNAMKECCWDKIKPAIREYKTNRCDCMPSIAWQLIHKLVYKK